MPNHCINELIFRDVDADAERRILNAACNGGGKVDFGVLVPMPLNMWWGSVGSNHEAAFKRTGLAWAREHWGTKWNAYGHKPVERTATTLTLRFETAWCPPYPWLAALFNRLNMDFDHNWLKEGRCEGVHGEFRREGRFGVEWKETPAEPELQRHLHKLLWGVEAFEDDPSDSDEHRNGEDPKGLSGEAMPARADEGGIVQPNPGDPA